MIEPSLPGLEPADTVVIADVLCGALDDLDIRLTRRQLEQITERLLDHLDCHQLAITHKEPSP